MIRRGVGNEYWLFTQMEHARLAGEVAKHLRGVAQGTSHRDSLILACAQHDAGWFIHDDAPRITPKKKPVDVFEPPPFLGFAIWSKSARRVAAMDPYAGLLVSLHSLGISVFAGQQIHKSHPDLAKDPSWRFELNKFQHAQVELQETLRKQLGLRTDIPLEGGLARQSDDPREQELFYNFRIVQATDQLSLCMLCQSPPFARVALMPVPGGECIEHLVTRVDEFTLQVDPWPFETSTLIIPVEYRPVPMIDYADDEHLRREYAAAKVQMVETKVCAKG
jgi:hypothetical protein